MPKIHPFQPPGRVCDLVPLSIPDEATFSKQCYPRTSLPGCKGKLFRFERGFLRKAYRASFGIAPLHIINIFISMICSNHVNRYHCPVRHPRARELTLPPPQKGHSAKA